MILLWTLIAILGLIVLVLGSSVRVITQYQRGVVLRFGQLREAPRGPGLTLIAPLADRLHKVNMQVVTMPVPGAAPTPSATASPSDPGSGEDPEDTPTAPVAKQRGTYLAVGLAGVVAVVAGVVVGVVRRPD